MFKCYHKYVGNERDSGSGASQTSNGDFAAIIGAIIPTLIVIAIIKFFAVILFLYFIRKRRSQSRAYKKNNGSQPNGNTALNNGDMTSTNVGVNMALTKGDVVLNINVNVASNSSLSSKPRQASPGAHPPKRTVLPSPLVSVTVQ